MRMAELSAVSRVSIPTIKRYLREGLLPAGRRTGPNQARYDARHVRRLRQIRMMTEIGGLTVGEVGAIITVADTAERDVELVLAAMDCRMAPWARCDENGSTSLGQELVDELCSQRGWVVDHDAVPARALARLLALAMQCDDGRLVAQLGDRAAIMEQMAALDLQLLTDSESGECEFLDSALLSTMLGDAMLIALRRLAQHHLLGTRYV